MSEQEFLRLVQERAGLPGPAEADLAASATLATLADRLTAAEAGELAALLPAGVARHMERDRAVAEIDERLTLEAFFERLAERAGVAVPDAVLQGRAVIDALRERLAARELSTIHTQISAELDRIYDAGVQG